ncbi:Ig-like domain-containing protein [Vibrio parahaemolyticus]|uniref:Ig-like domain-containing protein n=1 Tax=Vibrio parahaemolyticus TaxID=670 RepID=UPI0024BCD77C|nr:Ig-like domain-containing protein [Vibrio parahaemolyticus]WHT05021.1 Ig-like domain-containing protein [Vibrio parahaemolyticus]
MYRKSIFILIFTSCVLTACKSEDTNNIITDRVESGSAINAQDIMRMAEPNSNVKIKIDKNVTASDLASSVKLSSVENVSSNQDCEVENISDFEFQVKTGAPTVCTLKYNVSNGQSSATAYARMLIQDKTAINKSSLESFTIPPKSFSVDADSCTSISLQDIVPDGVNIQPNVEVIGNGTVSSIDSSSNTLNYCATDVGISRLFYSALDSVSNQYYIGTLLIGVSVDGNQSPEVSSFSYYFDPANMLRAVPAYEEVVIDVNEFVSDPDGDLLQIVDMQSSDATVSPYDESDFHNTKIKFIAKIPGQYYVNYLISDHNGGYGVGVIDVRVSSPISDYYHDTGDIETSFTLSSPLVESLSNKYGFDYKATTLVDGFVTDPLSIALYEAETANAYCKARGGRLPSFAEITSITQSRSNQLALSATWPEGLSYWLYDVGADETSIYKDGTGSVSNSEKDVLAAVSCLNLNIRDFEIRNPFYVITGTYKDLEVTYTDSSGESKFYTKGLTWESSDPSVLTVNPTTGRAVGRSKGTATVTATSRDGKYMHSRDVEVLDEIFMFGMGSLNTMYGYGFNAAVETEYKNGRTIAANAVLKSRQNFGPEGTVNIDAKWVFETANDYKYAELRDALDRDYPPAIVQIGYPNVPDATTTNRLRDFLYDGGVLMYFSQTKSSTSRIMESLFGEDVGVGLTSNSSGGGVFQFKDIDDPLVNGAFGDIRNKYWGSDHYYVSYVHNLPENSVVAYTNGFDVSGNTEPSVGDEAITALRHKKLKFVWTGDAGFIGFNVYGNPLPDDDPKKFPFNVRNYKYDFDDPEADWTPVEKPGYGHGIKYDVSNSIFFANAITWMFGADSHGED